MLTMRTAEVAWVWGVVCASGLSWWMVAPQAEATVRIWDGSSDNNWFGQFNWNPAGTPTFGDDVIIGAGPNNAVVLGSPLTAAADTVTLAGGTGASLNTNGQQLRFDLADRSGRVLVGDGASLFVSETGPAGNPGLFGDTLAVQDGGTVLHAGNQSVLGVLDIDTGGQFSGTGDILVSRTAEVGQAQIVNDGTISVGSFGAGDLMLRTLATGVNQGIDLDGLNGNGIVRATNDAFLGGVASANLTINGQLADAFGGTMEIARADSITFLQSWELNGDLVFRGSDDDPATLSGNRVTGTAGADVQVTQGRAVWDAPATFTGGGLTAAGGTTLEVRRSVRFEEGSQVDLTGGAASPTTLNVIGDGTFLSARLLSLQPTFDLDGASGDNVVNLQDGGSLWISGDLETSALDGFDGTLTMGTNTSLTLEGRAVFDAGSTFSKSGSGQSVGVRGLLRIDTPVDLDGTGSGDDLTGYFVGSSPGYGGAVMDVNVAMETSGGGAFDGRFLVGGTLDIDVPGSAAWTLGSSGQLDLTVAGRRAGLDRPATPGRATVQGDTIFLDGTLAGNGVLASNVNARGGSVITPGAGETQRGGLPIDVEDGTGLLTWDGAGLTLNAGSNVTLQFGGDARGAAFDGFDAIDAVGLSINGGDLTLNRIGTYIPVLYEEHVILRKTGAGDVNGVFDTVTSFGLSEAPLRTAWAVTYRANEVIAQRAIEGDANLNGQVEQGDLNAVLNNWGRNNLTNSATDVSWVTGDLDGDGRVAQGDLNRVLNNWGDQFNAPDFTGFAVPEPALAALVLPGLFMARRGSRPLASP
ncbi:MAG: hypothetical protein AAF328_08400 [Planctomycetota bacterium]